MDEMNKWMQVVVSESYYIRVRTRPMAGLPGVPRMTGTELCLGRGPPFQPGLRSPLTPGVGPVTPVVSFFGEFGGELTQHRK